MYICIYIYIYIYIYIQAEAALDACLLTDEEMAKEVWDFPEDGLKHNISNSNTDT